MDWRVSVYFPILDKPLSNLSPFTFYGVVQTAKPKAFGTWRG